MMDRLLETRWFWLLLIALLLVLSFRLFSNDIPALLN
jgi:hypothetical protein